MTAKTIRSAKLLRTAFLAAVVLFCLADKGAVAQTAGSSASSGPAVPSPVQIPPARQQLGFMIFQLQAEALKGDQVIIALAKRVFDMVVSYRLNQDRFPASISDLQRLNNRTAAANTALPPRNPYGDPSTASKELRQELINEGKAPSEFCQIIIENDPLISASFPLSLNNIKLTPQSAAPGTIVVKHNDYYLAVWCMGFSGKPILDEKTQLPLVLFKDFSLSSCRYSERAGE